jgi:hypothetical protein
MANSNPDPLKARMGKRKKKQSGSVQAAARIVWDALQTAQSVLSSKDTTERLKACHAVFQGAQAYARVVEIGEFEARLAALEASHSPMPQSKGLDHAENLN